MAEPLQAHFKLAALAGNGSQAILPLKRFRLLQTGRRPLAPQMSGWAGIDEPCP